LREVAVSDVVAGVLLFGFLPATFEADGTILVFQENSVD